MTAFVELRDVAKTYGLNPVLEDLTLSVDRGEILALVGENGAGKSTLMRIVGGYVPPTAGTALICGRPLPATVQSAEDAGIVLIHQEFCLAPDLTVGENIFIGREPRRHLLVDYPKIHRDSRLLLDALGSSADPRAKLSGLPNTEWQMVEVAKAFARNPKLLLMDEPTAVLGAREVEALFRRMRQFVSDGGSIIFTSHRLDEVKAIASRVAVLRDGRIRHVGPASELTEDEMAALMVGRELSQLYPVKSAMPAGDVVLSVDDLQSPPHVSGISFRLRRGEILGIAGLVGSGRTEAFEALAGLRPAQCRNFAFAKAASGHLPKAREAWAAGLAYLTEDRKGKGLLLDAGLDENVSLTVGALRGRAWINRAEERGRLDQAVREFDIRRGAPNAIARSLSGGNQQKVLIAKTLASRPDVVIFDEPTRGVDIGSKQQIYRVIAGLAAQGAACVVISSEMQEVIGLAHRVLVMRKGSVAGELTGNDINEGTIVRLAMGLTKEAA
ncbi:sugar ABC transporter ATP-binding protein [Mesorhizobium sp. B2-4-12]|uniref:sugar ABC transporter ATP-binding protein n=1 Tax=Mesorhizobium sp. B2-4-12 TaxID=2589937 RepID=UPI00112EC985|nr:sugar ABC transporter ATP-binding protein [Mesorhizobium sp. B2-4-12]TPK97720.1 sugar ABC transporter ATP-binding protein [Mesorhizobium sp. B2-4-12]